MAQSLAVLLTAGAVGSCVEEKALSLSPSGRWQSLFLRKFSFHWKKGSFTHPWCAAVCKSGVLLMGLGSNPSLMPHHAVEVLGGLPSASLTQPEILSEKESSYEEQRHFKKYSVIGTFDNLASSGWWAVVARVWQCQG